MFGVPALRSEDPRFLTGQGRYLENLRIDGCLRAVFVRSIMPHARLGGVQADAGSCDAGRGDGDHGDLDLPTMPPSGTVEGSGPGTLEGTFGREVLAREVVRFVGEPIVMIVAESLPWPRMPPRR